MPDLFTIGYEGADPERFMTALQDAGVSVLADVRAVALSRKRGFSKNALREGVERAGMDYRHFIALGTPKPGRDAARAGDAAPMARIYSDEVLAESKLDAVDADGMAFSIGLGNGENVFLAPGVGQLRNFQDAERLREFAESWRAEAEEYAKGFAAQPSDRFAAPMAPSAPVPPRAGAGSAAADERWQRMEERLERLEKMLERLAEQRRGAGGRSGGGAGG